MHLCTSADFYNDLIEPSKSTDALTFLDFTGVCPGDSASRINQVVQSDAAIASLTSNTINNQFNTRPFCLAFIVTSVMSATTLVYADGAALITFDVDSITFTLGGNTANFTTFNLVTVTTAQRVQICIDATGAKLFTDCTLRETVDFSAEGIPPISRVSVLLSDTAIPFDVSRIISS